MRHLSLSVALFMALLLPATTKAQTKIKLRQADRLASDQGAKRDFIRGNVVFAHGNTTIYCDSAYFNRKANSVEAFGNVRMQMANDTIIGRRLRYNGNTSQADFQPVFRED
jgi:lipopolysaccharide assembly outer membrane protein LptD (OstA)